MDKRQAELLLRSYAKKSERFLMIIQGYYLQKKEDPNIQEMLKVSNLILFCQGNREAAKEFFKQTVKEPKPLQGYLDFMEALDKALADANPTNDPVMEHYLIYKVSGAAITLMITTYPGIPQIKLDDNKTGELDAKN